MFEKFEKIREESVWSKWARAVVSSDSCLRLPSFEFKIIEVSSVWEPWEKKLKNRQRRDKFWDSEVSICRDEVVAWSGGFGIPYQAH